MSQDIVFKYLKEHPNQEYTAKGLYIALKKDNKEISSFQAFTINLRALKKHSLISSLPRIVRTFKGYEVLKLIYFYNVDKNGFQDRSIVHIETYTEEDFYRYMEK